MSKGYKWLIAIIVFISVGIGIYSYSDNIKTYKITKYNIDALVQKNGDVRVVEDTDYNFKGNYNGITITLPYAVVANMYNNNANSHGILPSSLYNNDGLKDIHIYVVENGSRNECTYKENAKIGDSKVYSVSTSDGYITYKVFEPSYNENKKIIIEYTLKNVVLKHADIAEFYWNFVGGNVDCNISNLDICVKFEESILSSELKGYTHGNFTGDVSVKNSSVLVHYSNVSKGEYVAVRAAFPTAMVKSSLKNSNQMGLQYINAEESVIEEKSNTRIVLNEVALLLAIILLFYWIFLLIKYEKDHAIYIEPDDELKVLDKYNPMIAACISQCRDMHPRDIIAVLINLVNKKVLTMETKQDLNNADKKLYYIEKNKIFFENEDNSHKLDQIEKLVITIFFETESKIELKEYTNSIADNKKALSNIKTLDEYVSHHLENIGANKQKMPKYLLWINNIIFIIVCIFIAGIICYNISLSSPTIGNSIYAYAIFGLVIISVALPFFLYAIYFIVWLLSFITKTFKSSIKKIAYKILPKDIFITASQVVLTSLFVFIILAIFVGSTYILAITFLFSIALLIIKTDNIMNKHSKEIIKDFFILKSIEDRIINGNFDQRNIESQIVWDKYLTYAIALGATSVTEYAKDLELTEDFNNLLQEIENLNLYEIYSAQRDQYAGNNMRLFLSSISSISSSWVAAKSSGGGFSGGGSSFGGGGFSGGGGGGGGRGAF